MKAQASVEFAKVHDLILSSVHPWIGHVSADLSWFLLKVSRNGMEGYLGRGPTTGQCWQTRAMQQG